MCQVLIVRMRMVVFVIVVIMEKEKRMADPEIENIDDLLCLQTPAS